MRGRHAVMMSVRCCKQKKDDVMMVGRRRIMSSTSEVKRMVGEDQRGEVSREQKNFRVYK
jgi:hypothetical protein